MPGATTPTSCGATAAGASCAASRCGRGTHGRRALNQRRSDETTRNDRSQPMTIAYRLRATQHPFLDGRPKRLLIGADWVDAQSGRTFDTLDPGTGKVLASVAEG